MNNACMALEFTFICPLSNGFHARPASHLAGMASDFIADCALTNLRNGATANMKSVLSIIAADIRLNDKCSILIQGPDEQIARATLRHFVGKDLPAYDAPLALLQEQKSRGLPCFLRSAGVTAYFGQAVSRGIGQGKTVIIGTVGPPSREVPAKGLDRTWEEEQVKRSISAERARIENKMLEHLSATEAGILHAHLAILGDVSLLDKILEGVAQGYSAAQAVMDASRFFAGLLPVGQSVHARAGPGYSGHLFSIARRCFRPKIKIRGGVERPVGGDRRKPDAATTAGAGSAMAGRPGAGVGRGHVPLDYFGALLWYSHSGWGQGSAGPVSGAGGSGRCQSRVSDCRVHGPSPQVL